MPVNPSREYRHWLFITMTSRECYGVSYHRYLDCLFHCFFRRITAKAKNKDLHYCALYEENCWLIPPQRVSNVDSVSMSWHLICRVWMTLGISPSDKALWLYIYICSMLTAEVGFGTYQDQAISGYISQTLFDRFSISDLAFYHRILNSTKTAFL